VASHPASTQMHDTSETVNYCAWSWSLLTVAEMFHFLLSFILSRVRGTILLYITPAVYVDVGTEKNFIVFISQFSWPKKLNILWWVCVSFYNAFGEFLFIDICTHISLVYYVWGCWMKVDWLIWVGHAAHVRMRNAYKDLDREPERKRPLGRPMYRWKDTISIDFR
jgi:hypothetical protein